MGLNRHSNRQALELYVSEQAEDLLGLRLTAGSGNHWGDGDLKPRATKQSHTPDIMIECKDRSTVQAHSVPTKDWEKALGQARKSGNTLIFVTRNQDQEVVAHLRFQDLLGIIRGYEWTIDSLRTQLEQDDT